MSLLHIISGGGSGGTGLLPGLGNLLNGALRGVNDLLDISNSLNLPSLSSALNTNSLLSNSLLNTVNRLLDADADTTVIEDLFGTLNGLLSRGQSSFAQGLIDTVNRLLDGNVSTTVIDDLVNTVNRLLSNGQTGLVDDLTNTVNSLLGAGQGNLVDDLIATVNGLLVGGQTTLIDDLTNTVNRLLTSGQTGLIDDLTNTVNSLLGAGQGNLVDDLIATVNGLLVGGQTTLIDDLTNTVNRLLTSGQTGLIDDLTNTVNSLLGAGQGNLVDDLIATVNNLIDGQAATTVINDLLVAVNQLLGSTNLNLIDDLLNSVNNILIGGGVVTNVISIVDDLLGGTTLPVISVIASDAIAAEGGSNTGTFTLSRTGSTAQALTVAYTLAGTATNGSDFSQLSGSVTFAAGSNTATVTLSPINDSLVEGDETVILSIANNPSYSIAPGQGSATVTIQDNDTPPVALPVISVIASDAIAAEGGSNTGTFTLSRTGSTAQTLTVAYTLAGTATNGSDFSQLSGSVTFAAGSNTATVTLSPINDSLVEGDETVILSIANNPSYSIAPGQGSATVTIQDNDTPPVALPVISVIASDAIAAEGGSNTGTFTLSRTGNTAQTLTVAYTLAGTATNGSDFNQLSGSVTFAAGSNTATVTLSPINDSLVEGDETVILSIANNPSYSIAPGQGSATVTIQDNDTPPVALPVISVIASDAIAAEGGSNTGTFTLSRTGNTAQTLTVAYTLAGTATNGSDFNQLSGSVTFAAGSNTATVTLSPINDSLVEGDETVILSIANNPSYSIAPGQGSATVTIQDNDTPPVALPVISVIASDAIAAEGGSNTGTFTLSRTGNTAQTLTVAYTLAGTATNGSDFNQLSGSVTFAAGSNTATVTLSPINDSLVEGDETVILSIANNPSYSIAPGQGSATVTIQDNDQGSGPIGSSFRDYQDLVVELAETNGNLGSWRDNLIPQPGRPGPEQAAIQAQRLYIGYYNRAADAGGQQFWVSRLITSSDIGQASRDFANLPEAQALYPILANPNAASDEAIASFINSVFRNVFNRDVDPVGASFFLQRFKELRNSPIQGRVGEIVTQILDGAIGSDATILTQKVALANAYTDSLILSNTPYNPEFGQNGIFSTLEAGASTTEGLNVAKIVGQGKAPFLDGTTGSDTLTSFGGSTIVDLGNDTVTDQLIFTSPARGGDLVQLFRSQDVLAIQSSGFAGAPLPTADPITNSVTAATNTANTILVDLRSNLDNANFSNVRFAFDLSSGSLLYDADGNFGGTADQTVLAQLDGFVTSGLILKSTNFDFIS
ncbi:beta strand repeat-containing protein [Synechococcus elongatus]|uniref:beta strand repeat-containing protein n=1 Tax=Synechococcus elongatus TaxID=32046 RepID=UPI0030D28C48